MIGGFRGSIPLTSLGFAAMFGAISGVTTAATAAIGTLTYPRMRAGRLQRAVRLGADHRRRRDRQPHSAVDRDYHLRHRLRHLDHRAVRRRHRSGAAAGGAVRHLHLLPLGAELGIAETEPVLVHGIPRWRPATASGRSAPSASSSAASIRACSRRPKRPASPASTPSSSAISSIARSRSRSCSKPPRAPMYLTGSDLHHRLGRRPLCLAADDQRHRAAGGEPSSPACTRSPGWCC